MKLKIQNEENKLIIKMKKDFNTLNKTIHLHENAIKSIQGLNHNIQLEINKLHYQGLAASFNLKKGMYEGELKRRKLRMKE